MAKDRTFAGLFALLAALLPALEAGAQTTRVEVTDPDCRRLVRHQSAADVAYQAGQDVYGRAVAPADLGGGVDLDLPRTYSFDIDIQPFAYARRRQLEADRAVLARDLQANAQAAETLEVEAATLAAREATTQATFEAAAAAIIAATGGPTVTNPATLATRTARLDALRTNTLTAPAYLDLQEDLARNREAQALNRAQAEALFDRQAELDEEAATISQRGLDATTMTVGRVTVDTVTGETRFNGRPLQADAEAALVARCREALRPGN